MKRAPRVFFLLLSLPFCLPTPLSAAESSVRVSYRPTEAQVAAWTAPGPLRPEPVVSLKVFLPKEAEALALFVDREVWEPVEAPALLPRERPAFALGARGTFRNRSYAEVLIRPVQPLPDGKGLLLTGAEIILRWKSGQGAAAPDLRLVDVPPSSPPAPGLKIVVREEGLYRLTAADLAASGMDLSGTVLEAIHLSCRGFEVPIAFEGASAGVFTSGSALLFFGEPPRLPPRPLFNGGDFTDDNVYWLRVDPSVPSLRMEPVNAAPAFGFPVEGSFQERLHVERDDFFFNIYHYRPNGDLWYMGSPVYRNQPRTYALPLFGLAAPPVKVEALVAALSSGTHSLSATLNGHPPSAGPNPAAWSGLGLSTFSWTFTEGLVPGEAALVLSVPTSNDYQIPDFFDVTYERNFEAREGILDFTVPDRDARYAVTGLPSPPILLDLTERDPESGLLLPRLLLNALFTDGTSTFELPAGGGAERRLYAASVVRTPISLAYTAPRDLSSPSLGADFLVLTHPDFHPPGGDAAFQGYLERRRRRFAVEVVDIGEVYDNFSHGLFDPTAVRAFLAAAAARWNPRPRYVLLIGDATYDYKNVKGDPTLSNWVPTMMFEDLTDFTYMGRYPSDAWFADVDADGYPDMAVGRLPVRTYDELSGLLEKIAAYEDQPLAGSWYKTGLFVADTYTNPWEQEFETYNTYLRSTFFAPPWSETHLYFHDPPYNGTSPDAFAAALRGAWPQAALVHYAGHSGVAFWGKNHAFFTAFPSRNCSGETCQDSDVDLLSPISTENAPLPFVLNSSCYNSAFDEVKTLALMEDLVKRADRGAIGASGFTTIAYPDEEETFNSAFLGEAFGREKVRDAGDLVDAGRFALPSTLARAVLGNVLLGDPALRLRLPAPPPPTGLLAEGADGAARLSWTPPSPEAAAFRVYLSLDGGAGWTFVLQVPGTQQSAWVTGLENGTEVLFTLTSVDAEGFEGPTAEAVSALPVPTPCTLDCSASVPVSVSAGVEVAFSGTVTPDHCEGAPSFLWDFGDGSTSSDPSPRHLYALPGTYPWSLTVEMDGALCTRGGTLTVVTPPEITSVTTALGPFRLILRGGNFHPDARVYVGESAAPWPWATVKSAAKIVLKGGASLKAALPKGVPVFLRVVNGDGGEKTVVFTR